MSKNLQSTRASVLVCMQNVRNNPTPPNAKNAFAFSKLAVCIAFLFASAGNVAYADTSITIKDNSPIDSAEELQEFNQQLSATDQNKVVIVENSTAIVFRPDMDKGTSVNSTH